MTTPHATGERRFRAMGSDAHVVIVAASAAAVDALVEQASERIAQLERRWSRFLDTSEVSQLNARPGRPVLVSNDTFVLVSRAVDAWRLTGGRFDPTVIDAVEALGYSQSFDDLAQAGPVAALAAGRAAPGCGGIVLDAVVGTITLPAGVRVDPGGIGKGLAADLVCEELRASGADGAMVNLGGDLRASGTPPEGDVWVVGVDDPMQPGHQIGRVVLVDGAVCTSSRAKRRWRTTDGRERHHLVDPATGESLSTGLVAATVLAGAGWWAEATAKAVFSAGPTAAPDALVNASALLVADDGAVTVIGPDTTAFLLD